MQAMWSMRLYLAKLLTQWSSKGSVLKGNQDLLLDKIRRSKLSSRMEIKLPSYLVITSRLKLSFT